jgi:hypothetical protein
MLILMILAEGMGAPAMYLHISGGLLLIGRIAHPFGLKADNAGHPLRYAGNGTNILASLNTMICLSVNILGDPANGRCDGSSMPCFICCVAGCRGGCCHRAFRQPPRCSAASTHGSSWLLSSS